ncbi:MAG: hypothetical protein ABI782_00110 [Anaerolineaceae bacterium]
MKPNWKDDSALQEEMHRRGVRSRVVRSAIVWSPLAVIMGLLFLYFVWDTALNSGGHGGSWVLVTIMGVMAGLFAFQAGQALLDLFGEPSRRTGLVTRRWSRSDSFVIKSHYIRLGKQILRGDAFQLAGIKEGDYVDVTYYPNSAVIIWLDKVPAPEPGTTAGPELTAR